MQIRSLAWPVAGLVVASSAAAAPEEFDAIQIEFAVGAGGVAEGESVGPEIDFGFAFDPGVGFLEVDASDGFRTAIARLDYDFRVEPGPNSLTFVGSLSSTINLAFAATDTSGSLEAFTSLDDVELEFVIEEPATFDLAGLTGELIGLGGTPSVGPIGEGSVEIMPGSYAFRLVSPVTIAEPMITPGPGGGTFMNELGFSATITTVPAPASLAMLTLAGAAAARRRR